ncbi:LysM peptidoglycan-binding domain-containing protein [Mycobacterium haemophilum]
MTVIYAVPPRTGNVRRPMNRPIPGPRCGRDELTGSRRPAPSRPAGAPMRYSGSGVVMSVAPHCGCPVSLAKTIGLALLAGVITLWLGLMAHFSQVINGDAAGFAAHVPDRLAVVRVEAGESLQDVAARVAPDAPVRQVSERIRELNALNSPALVAGQTLIAPVG